jgi:hypothetical protein
MAISGQNFNKTTPEVLFIPFMFEPTAAGLENCFESYTAAV